MISSLRSKYRPLQTGKASPASAGSLFPLDSVEDFATFEKCLSRLQCLTPKILLALAVVHMLGRTVTPQKLCACGCGAFVIGKAVSAGPACRKRLERARRRGAGQPGRQFNLTLQDEMQFKIETIHKR